ncbi:MAG: 4a-hydroxytetrahydrobiopterin dehydratase, partial [Chitinophagaceae bacterium]|nr:4a-hydroxytetrahydrobiopterin dehydratase [Chitinophagaceae bacterium]
MALFPGWELKDAALERQFLFKDFSESLAFIVQVGILAEKADHHPVIHNVYNQVTLRLNTHSAGAITNKDTQMALQINAIMASSDPA